MKRFTHVVYIEFDGAHFFTVVLLPQKEGTFPTVILRTPYVQSTLEMSDEAVEQNCLNSFECWLDRGYAVVYQHCRGQGKSTGRLGNGFESNPFIMVSFIYLGEVTLLLFIMLRRLLRMMLKVLFLRCRILKGIIFGTEMVRCVKVMLIGILDCTKISVD